MKRRHNYVTSGYAFLGKSEATPSEAVVGVVSLVVAAFLSLHSLS
jgi:hypothetical protein